MPPALSAMTIILANLTPRCSSRSLGWAHYCLQYGFNPHSPVAQIARPHAFNPNGSRIVTTSLDKLGRIWDVRFATMATQQLVLELCMRQLCGTARLSRDEMRLAGYPESTPEIDVCEGVG